MYQHTQPGTGVWIIIGLALVLILVSLGIAVSQLKAAGSVYPSDQSILLRLLGVMFVLAMALLLFFRLTVIVDEHYVRAIFGIGIIGKRIPLGEVMEVRLVTNPWWWGWGIRLIPGGWMWNISGLKAVELKMKSGRIFRIGSDEPQVLAEVIKNKLAVSV
jgi:hypothetical protein